MQQKENEKNFSSPQEKKIEQGTVFFLISQVSREQTAYGTLKDRSVYKLSDRDHGRWHRTTRNVDSLQFVLSVNTSFRRAVDCRKHRLEKKSSK